jgi:hypothetical protein
VPAVVFLPRGGPARQQRRARWVALERVTERDEIRTRQARRPKAFLQINMGRGFKLFSRLGI